MPRMMFVLVVALLAGAATGCDEAAKLVPSLCPEEELGAACTCNDGSPGVTSCVNGLPRCECSAGDGDGTGSGGVGGDGDNAAGDGDSSGGDGDGDTGNGDGDGDSVSGDGDSVAGDGDGDGTPLFEACNGDTCAAGLSCFRGHCAQDCQNDNDCDANVGGLGVHCSGSVSCSVECNAPGDACPGQTSCNPQLGGFYYRCTID